MPDDVITESSPAAPSAPATDQSTVTAEPSYRQRLDALTFVQRKEWQKTGQLPEVKKSAAAPQKEAVETAPESEPGIDDDGNDKKVLTAEERSERDKQNNSRRWNKLQREIGARDAEIARLKSQLAAGTKTESAPVKQAAPKVEAPARPKLTDFVGKIGKDYQTYEEAVDAHAEALTDWKIEDREQKQRSEAKRQETEKSETEVRTTFQNRTQAMRETHEDFDSVVFTDKLPLNQAALSFAVQREHGLTVLYHLGKNLKEAERISKLDPIDTFAELRQIEKELTKAPPPVKTATEAPPPPQHVGGRATAVDDPIEAALKNKDWKTYNRLRNQRDLEKRGVSAGRK